MVRQGQSIHPHEDERKRGGAQGGEDQGGNERVERGVGVERIVFTLRVHSPCGTPLMQCYTSMLYYQRQHFILNTVTVD